MTEVEEAVEVEELMLKIQIKKKMLPNHLSEEEEVEEIIQEVNIEVLKEEVVEEAKIHHF